MGDFEGKVFLVTGAASGIGRGTTEHIVAGGGNVVLVDLDADRLAAVAATLGADRALVVPTDVTDGAAVAAAVAAGLERFGRLDGVVTSAGIFAEDDLAPIAAMDFDVFDRVLAVNLRGTLLTIHAALPHLDSGASIVTVASTAGLRGHGHGAAYTASKGAVVALTRLLAGQVGPSGIRVNCVCPGATAGEGMGANFRDPAFTAAMTKHVPLRRVGLAEEVGATIAALLGDNTSYVTGQVIAVDGGATSQ